MAKPVCENHEDRESVFVGTFLADGKPVAVCDECLALFALSIASTLTGIDPTPFLEAISEDTPPPVEPGDQEPAAPDPTASNGTGRPHPAPGSTGPDTSDPEAADAEGVGEPEPSPEGEQVET